MKRPTVTLKLATSLDGRIATAAGESRWITGEAARAEVQRLRASHGAVMIGAETARRDNPSLLARIEPAPPRQPIRVVVTSRFDIAPDSALVAGLNQSPLIVFGADRSGPARRAILEAAGVQVEGVPHGASGLDVSAVLSRLAALGVASVLVEGGGKIAAALIRANVVDRLEWFRAPILLGASGRAAVGELDFRALAQAPAWRRVALREVGADLWESYERVA